MARQDLDLVIEFNSAINSQDLDSLTRLMSPDYRFVDSSGAVVAGRASCREAWASFFESFPDYRNVFEAVRVVEPGHVVADGHSECSFAPLHGPARWHAIIAGRLIVEWRIEAPE